MNIHTKINKYYQYNCDVSGQVLGQNDEKTYFFRDVFYFGLWAYKCSQVVWSKADKAFWTHHMVSTSTVSILNNTDVQGGGFWLEERNVLDEQCTALLSATLGSCAQQGAKMP